MHKAEIYNLLKKQKITHEITEHEAVFSMNELREVEVPYPEADAKNLFVRDDKKRNYYMITVMGPKRVNLKQFEKSHGLRHLSFASAEDMQEYLQLTPGSVSPFGLLNDQECIVKWYYDADFMQSKKKLIGIHPNDNTATVWLKIADLIKLLEKHGTIIEEVEL